MEEIVSVVIPVYNVELYLERCIDSVIDQTYENLEIILVDDGSSDSSGKICDDYAKDDSRINVIHKKNGGLSDARNTGIDVATGMYIMFVDSDDWISRNCVELLIKALQWGKTQISACTYQKTDRYREDAEIPEYINDYIEVWTIDDAYRHLFFNKEIDNSACAKLYKRSLFKNIRFPVGKLYEDQFVTYKLFHIAQGVTYIGQRLYYYFDRPGSIQNEAFTIRKMDELEAAQECVRFIDEIYPHLHEAVICRMVSSCFHMLFAITDRKKWKREFIVLKKIIFDNRRRMVFGKDVNKKVRLGCLCSYLGLGITKQIYMRSGVRGKISV